MTRETLRSLVADLAPAGDDTTEVLGRFSVGEELGRGGMGRVRWTWMEAGPMRVEKEGRGMVGGGGALADKVPDQ